jgi:hypothetical protein
MGMKVFHKKWVCAKPVEKGCGLLKRDNLIIHNLSIEDKGNFKNEI